MLCRRRCNSVLFLSSVISFFFRVDDLGFHGGKKLFSFLAPAPEKKGGEGQSLSQPFSPPPPWGLIRKCKNLISFPFLLVFLRAEEIWSVTSRSCSGPGFALLVGIGPLLLYGKGKGRGGILFLGVKRFIFGRVPAGAFFYLG